MLVSRESPKLPSILYKYRYFDDNNQHIDSLAGNYLWCTSPKQFNDPFDCAISYDFSGSEDEKLQWARQFLKREAPYLTENEIEALAKAKIEEIENDPERVEWTKNIFIESNYEQFGMCCLTPHKDSILMWSHYSFNHTGFCIGIKTSAIFDVQQNLLKSTRELLEVHKVDYSYSIPKINFYEAMLMDRNNDHLSPLITVKSNHWEYEEEYRLIYWDKANQPLYLNHQGITEIILGCRVSESNIKKIISICKNSQLDVTIQKSLKHDEEFSLKFEDIASIKHKT